MAGIKLMEETMSPELFAAAVAMTRLGEKSIAIARLRLVDGLTYREIRARTGATYGVAREKEMKVRYFSKKISTKDHNQT